MTSYYYNRPTSFGSIKHKKHDCDFDKHDCDCHKHDCDCKKHDCDCKKHDCKCFREPDCKPEKIKFRCSTLTGATGIGVIAIGGLITPTTIGTISVSDLCCFKKPCVQLEISAIITIGVAIAVGTTITFRVFRRCDNQDEVEIQSFNLPQGVVLAVGSSIPVAFVVCDCNACPANCCTYRVTVEATAAVAVASAINVGQGGISLIAGNGC
ncbi:hypothetical protein CLPU_3c00010 [Gottschalkia purinilytica]|uniref:DUF4489 domain-containing protein n=1 Tax=Gottschalkia purinilytica TaxID=1503 RepID=A0A0L0WCN1_GOTPU|nr:DUF4489 domain-containing protein [Gottschalkia purinilytica]KNF09223.1 hypothetical protein CLPU_3c00010 [Gottschalkia purinilytica]